MTANFFNTIAMTLLPIFALRELGLTPAMLGIVFSLSAVGGLLGAIATPRIVARIGEARAIPISAIGFCLVPFFLPAISLVPALAFPFLVDPVLPVELHVLLYNITQVTFRQRITPPRLLGRMNASVRFVVWGVMPISALIAGALGTWIGVVPTLWIARVRPALRLPVRRDRTVLDHARAARGPRGSRRTAMTPDVQTR